MRRSSRAARRCEHSGLGGGEHTFQVVATDAAGNGDGSPATYTWTVEPPPDTVAPDTQITSPPPDPTGDDVNFRFTGSDAVTPELLLRFECRFDSSDPAAWTSCTSPRAYTGLDLGEHTFEVRAIDEAGNRDATPASYTWTVVSNDTTAPETTLDSAVMEGANATFTFSSSETGSTFTCSLDQAPSAPCDSPVEYTDLAVGEHTFLVRAKDAAGNVDSTAAIHEWTVEPPPDTTAPETTLGSGAPPATGTSTSATFNFTSSEQNSTFACSLDGAAFAPCSSPRTYSNLAVGSHTFRVRAIDASGNVDQSPATHSWIINQACNSSTATLGAAADSWILQDSANQNYGTDGGLKVDTKSGANARAAVRFNLPTIPAGCQVTNAKLRLYATSYKTGRTLQAWRLLAPWTEAGLTWNNQPQTTGTAATVASGSGYREWTVTQQVQAMYAPGANHGFLVRDATENGSGLDQVFHSREKGTDNPPRLVLTFAP